MQTAFARKVLLLRKTTQKFLEFKFKRIQIPGCFYSKFEVLPINAFKSQSIIAFNKIETD